MTCDRISHEHSLAQQLLKRESMNILSGNYLSIVYYKRNNDNIVCILYIDYINKINKILNYLIYGCGL